MRNFLIFSSIIIFLFILYSTSHSQTDSHNETDSFLEIPLIKELLNLPLLELDKSEELKNISKANKLLEETQQLLEQIEEIKRERNPNAKKSDLYLEAIRNLVKLIQEYPNSTAALTAKLRLVPIIFDITGAPIVLDVAGKLIDEIITEFPDTWQGKLAIWEKANYLFLRQKYNEAIVQVNTHFQEIKNLDDIQDSNFHLYKQKTYELNEKCILDANIRKLLIHSYIFMP